MIFELNGTIVIFVVSFLVFMWLLNQIMLKPVGDVIEQRSKLIDADLEASKNSRGEAQRLLEGYEDDLKKIRHDAHAVLTRATEEVSRERHSQLDRVAKEGQTKLDKAKADIAAERERLIDALVAEEKDLVETITRKVLGDESVQVSLDNGQVRRTLEEI
ncbi:MAG TPA: ATP synthase F0 subunit B [Candidatus Obscuribacterales bacterium]